MTTTDYAQLQAVRELLTRIPLSLDVDPEETGLPREGHGGAREAAPLPFSLHGRTEKLL